MSGVKDSAGNAAAGTGWNGIFRGEYLFRILVLASAVALHAVNLYLSTTLLPAVVADIGGMPYYAWNTSLFVVASVLGAVMAAPILEKHGPRAACIRAAVVFAAGSALCALAPTMAVMLCGRLVQGLGGGMLLALPYAMVRSVFTVALWPRAMALFSGMWGVATLLGPLVGGIHAGPGVWRVAFWMLVLAAATLAGGAAFALPRRTRPAAAIPALPWCQSLLLLSGVFMASVAGVAPFPWSAACLALAALLAAGMIRVESSASRKLLPDGAFRLSGPLGALYAVSALFAVTVTCEVFVPLFLQQLHGWPPLVAGFGAALLSAGWTVAAIFGSGASPARRRRFLAGAPFLSALSMLSLAALMPWPAGTGVMLLMCIALLAGGAAVGMVYPWLGAAVLREAPAGEQDLAASSLMTVQLCATAFGAAGAGLVMNLAAGIGSSVPDLGAAARWIFVLAVVAPLSTLPLRARLRLW